MQTYVWARKQTHRFVRQMLDPNGFPHRWGQPFVEPLGVYAGMCLCIFYIDIQYVRGHNYTIYIYAPIRKFEQTHARNHIQTYSLGKPAYGVYASMRLRISYI